MIKYLTIQKLAELIGVDTSYIRKMIKNKDLTAYKKDGYKRIYINIDEFNATLKPIDNIDKNINLDNYLV
ncbi:MAG: helix-turn-helix domain-containing protein [Sulfurimonas sp.]|nr:helix-turn-helix domain-containing protein [Sulfurimonas sp.]MDD3834675.1 helix-turn-helix domain-containing protein [Sulfurimonas sp.]